MSSNIAINPEQAVSELNVFVLTGEVNITTGTSVNGQISGPGAADYLVEYVGSGLLIRPIDRTAPLVPNDQTTGDRSVRIDVTAPADLVITLTTGSARLSVAAGSRVAVRSGSGTVSVHQADDLSVRSGSGEVNIGAVELASIRSGSGNVRIESVNRGRIKSATADVTVRKLNEDIAVRSGTGDVSIGLGRDDIPAWLDLASGSGEIDVAGLSESDPVDGDDYLSVTARTGSGRIEVRKSSSTSTES